MMTSEEASLYAEIVASTMSALTATRQRKISTPKARKTPTKSPKSAAKQSTPKSSIKKSPASTKKVNKSPKSITKVNTSPKSATKKSPKSASKISPASKPISSRKAARTPSTPMIIPSPPTPLSAPSSITRPLVASIMISQSPAQNEQVSSATTDISAHVAALSRDVKTLIQSSPHITRATRTGVAITPPTLGHVPSFQESPLTPAEIKPARRVTRSSSAVSPKL